MLCSQHGICYAYNTLDQHLADCHYIKRRLRQDLLTKCLAARMAGDKESITQPQDRTPAFYGLPVWLDCSAVCPPAGQF